MLTSRGRATAPWRILLLSLLGAVVAVLADKDPKVSVTTFKNPPLDLTYFEDSDVVLFNDVTSRVIYRSEDAGASWKPIDKVPEGEAVAFVMHAYDPKTAFVLTPGTKHYKTEDQGATWSEFDSKIMPVANGLPILVFHASDPKRIIFNGLDCDGIFCDDVATYTIDGFKTAELLRAFTSGCWWAKTTPEFTTGDDDLDLKRTICIVKDPFSLFKEDQRLHISDDFFAIVKDEVQEFEPNMDTSKGVSGVVNLATVKSFLLVATSSFNSDEMALYVTKDTIKWHRAIFPTDDSHDHSHRLHQEGYTVLESTNYSIQLDLMTSAHPSNPMGVLFTSNSNGTYFTENIPYTNRNERGRVDFEKISGIQGIFLVNTVDNGPEVDKDGGKKKIISRITFDDGRTFEPVKAGDDAIHLHAVTDIDNLGRIFSSPAPGLVMGNGNKGDHLDGFGDANLYVSDNAGLAWKQALEGPHKFEFGDSGSILIAVKDSKNADIKDFSFSLDHGQNWKSAAFPDKLEVHPVILTTTQDSTSSKFIMIATNDDGYHIIAVDFDEVVGRTCEDKDMEDWHARVDDDGKPTCIMGHKQTYRRRKKDADCLVRSKFKDPEPKTEDCECTDADFECDFNFQRDPDDASVCKEAGPMVDPDGTCKSKPDGTFQGSSGWRLIPGNTCKRKDGKQKDDPVERKCSGDVEGSKPPASGKISHTRHDFDTKRKDMKSIYLGGGDSGSIIAWPEDDATDNKLFLTTDHGKNWKRILEDEDIVKILPHLYFGEIVFFLTKGQKVIYTIDQGNSFHSFEAPAGADGDTVLSFHPDKKDWLIWLGKKCDEVGKTKSCFREAAISTDRGDKWETLKRYVEKCEFTGHSAYNFRSLKQIVCLARKEEKNDAPLVIVSSNDFFDDDMEIHEGDIENFVTMAEFIVVAEIEDESRRVLASLDGKHFEHAHFPYNFRAGRDDKYTVLDSSTHAVNLFVQTSSKSGHEYGSIIKSNSNGTSYVLSASNVNCNEETYVDFEKVSGLEGVVLINTVTNTKDDKPKRLQTKISHNDGSQWGFLPPPEKDADGKPYKCRSSKGDDSCALHLHHYTERDDKRDTFAAATAVGLLFGVGNVGSSLGDIKEADTFMTADGGITWTSVKKGHWTWQYGDQGSIIVLVERATRNNDVKTKKVSYSLDEGKTWSDYEFSDKEVTVLDITTMRSGTSRNFVLWCRDDKKQVFSVNVDFTGLTDRECKFTQGSDSDYYLWSPKHPLQEDDCLFGHVARYLRKKPEKQCYNVETLTTLREYKHCKCKREDYECAYNFELDNFNQCVLVPGLKPLTGQEWCTQNPNATTWHEPTGYRKVPLSTCVGGKELDKWSEEGYPCAGYEDEFKKKHRASGIAIFFAVIIPIGLAAAIGYYVYRNWSGKLGQIRLGEHTSTFDSDQPWIKYPVVAISAVAAVVAAIPLVASSVWRWGTGTYQRIQGGQRGGGSWLSGGGPRRFTTRDSFARGRSDYSMVDDDEGELLGDDSDEEVA
ncbi:vacuolar sorting protein [Stachybotrys elegans]|uniref:Vacuolar protein sorting/targeting protein 10 n=1 Tax=Stachybotrys elegans TaxID=80388 RepID=A0A8K0WWW6_9HYPO|nr:vacuolar sorting protein [Stachybotrys elegans]